MMSAAVVLGCVLLADVPTAAGKLPAKVTLPTAPGQTVLQERLTLPMPLPPVPLCMATASPRYAFTTLPCVKVVPPCEDADSGMCKMGQHGCASMPGMLIDAKRLFIDQPATFPLPHFTEHGLPVPRDGLIIHEGMSVMLYPTGRYQVFMTVTAPSMPITLRLQLQMRSILDKNNPFCEGDGGCGLLTLPPIVIPDRRITYGNYKGESWHISHEGYSHWVECHFTMINRFERSGTARFGHLPE